MEQPDPGKEDWRHALRTQSIIHNQLTDAGKILGLRVLDHIIVNKKNYYSFQEPGLIG
jgi:DNA repair protein RadC